MHSIKIHMISGYTARISRTVSQHPAARMHSLPGTRCFDRFSGGFLVKYICRSPNKPNMTFPIIIVSTYVSQLSNYLLVKTKKDILLLLLLSLKFYQRQYIVFTLNKLKITHYKMI
jgi:hypothetical protein